mmetsp:Transcript_36232/g.81588  ORF Transcript_36232/g.81588 Transcript_36232/m.81588 type:complete len:228 (+) Transcript_36232:851-1534(+)
MAFEVEVHPLAEPFLPEERVIHPDHFCSLSVHGDGIKVVHGDVALRPDRMSHGSVVLRKLHRANNIHVLDAFDSRRRHVHTELLVPEHSETFLEGQLEPVATGHSVAGPVMEVLVCNDPLNSLIICISSSLGACKDAAGVEDVERLVLHSAHVEVVDCDYIEHVQIVLKTKGLLIPPHRFLQRFHGVIQLLDVVVLGVHVQGNDLSGSGHERISNETQVTRHHGKEI